MIKYNWNEEMIAGYKENWQRLDHQELAKHYSLSMRTISYLNKKLGLIKDRFQRTGVKWIGERAETYRQLWETMTNKQLSRHYGISEKTVTDVNRFLGLKKNRSERIAKAYRHGSKVKPPSPTGSISYRKICTGHRVPFIRCEDGWMPLHRYNWMKAGNAIPEHRRLMFLDGDPTNCDLSNLSLQPESKRKQLKAERQTRKEARQKRVAEKQSLITQEVLFKKDMKRKAKELRDRAKAEKKKEIARQKAEQQLIAQNRKVSRRKEKPFATIQRDFSKMIAVRIDSRTIIYAKTPEEAERIRAKYIKISPLSKAS